jgi:hypothetical protein
MNYAGWQRRLCEPGRNELRRAEVGGREGVGGKEKTSAPPFPVATQRIYLETGVSMPVVASDGPFSQMDRAHCRGGRLWIQSKLASTT